MEYGATLTEAALALRLNFTDHTLGANTALAFSSDGILL